MWKNEMKHAQSTKTSHKRGEVKDLRKLETKVAEEQVIEQRHMPILILNIYHAYSVNLTYLTNQNFLPPRLSMAR